jgi:hypothetical protein
MRKIFFTPEEFLVFNALKMVFMASEYRSSFLFFTCNFAQNTDKICAKFLIIAHLRRSFEYKLNKEC